MAARYLRATGNWNGAVWADTSSGAAGSVATPTSSDDVYIQANFTVTLTADAQAGGIIHTNGTLSLGAYTLTLTDNTSSYGAGFVSSGSSARTINLNSGRLIVTIGNSPFSNFTLSGSSLTFNAGTSMVEINHVKFARDFATLSQSFNNVRINLGSASNSVSTDITGSPTFNLLEIRSANSAAHTVNFDASSFANVQKFIAIGSSSTDKLTLSGNSDGIGGTKINLTPGGTSYGQFVHANGVKGDTFSSVPLYLGSNSTQTTGMYGSMGWSLTNPPKISTLVDPLTTAPGSNSNWSTTGSVTQATSGLGGGGYRLQATTSATSSVVLNNTYDLVDNDFIWESSESVTYGASLICVINNKVLVDHYGAGGSNNLDFYGPSGEYLGFSSSGFEFMGLVKIRVNSVAKTLVYSCRKYTESSWTDFAPIALSDSDINTFRSSRIEFKNKLANNIITTTYVTLGSINIEPEATNTGAFLQLF